MAPDDIINENDGEQEEEQEQEPNIIDLNNYGMKPYAWRYEGSGGGGGGGGEGGGGNFVATFTHNNETGLTCDKTYSEISESIESGLNVKFHFIEQTTHAYSSTYQTVTQEVEEQSIGSVNIFFNLFEPDPSVSDFWRTSILRIDYISTGYIDATSWRIDET